MNSFKKKQLQKLFICAAMVVLGILSFIFAAIFLIINESNDLNSGSTRYEDGYYYNGTYTFYNNGGVYTLVEYTGSSSTLTLPNKINGCGYCIGDEAFYENEEIKSVTIPDNVTSIGSKAFYGCTSLTSVTIGSGVTSIGDHAFYNCSSLESIEIGSGVTSIEDFTFSHCISLNNITIGENVTSIGKNAFYSCLSLTSVTIPNSVKTIGENAFYHCSALESVTIGSSVLSIGDYAFDYCPELTTVYNLSSLNITAGSTKYGYVAYNANFIYTSTDGGGSDSGEATGELEYTLYNGTYTVSGIGTCTDADIVIPSTYNGKPVTAIGDYAFMEEYTITSVTIGSNVLSIGEYAFCYCTSLKGIDLPDSVITIGNYVFACCTSLKEVSIESNITNISGGAFYYCSMLESISLPDSITAIDAFAFYMCSSLENITIGSEVTSIGDYAFFDCNSLTSLVIPKNITYIGEGAFSDCDALAKITVNSENTAYKSVSNVLFSYDGTELIQYAPAKTETTYTIPSTVTTIGAFAFEQCTSLKSVVIPDSVIYINDYAFDCSGLIKVIIPVGVTYIGDYAFSECKSLTGITVNSGNSYYKSVNGVLYNYDCTELLQYGAGNTSASFTIPSTVTSITNGAFASCYTLQSVTIPSGILSIGEYAFFNCSSLTNITIPYSVTAIGEYAFYGAALDSVTFENTGGWHIALAQETSAVLDIDSAYLALESTAATYLTQTYYEYYWYCY